MVDDAGNTPNIVVRLRRGDRRAIRELYEQAFPQCASIVYRNNGDKEDAKDLFQEALLVLFNNVRRHDFRLTCDVKTYLFSVVRNLWLKRLNARKKGGLALVMDAQEEAYIIIAEDELEEKMQFETKHRHIAEILENFKADCRALLMSFYFQKKSLKEIAKAMGYTDQFVKVKKNRCMEALKKEVHKTFKYG